eukprot:scaffold137035_cov21-Tisochrysis_lutea.AAC.1
MADVCIAISACFQRVGVHHGDIVKKGLQMLHGNRDHKLTSLLLSNWKIACAGATLVQMQHPYLPLVSCVWTLGA